MQPASTFRHLAPVLILAIVMAALLAIVQISPAGSALGATAAVLAGMAAFSALNGLQRYFDPPGAAPIVRITINENLLRAALDAWPKDVRSDRARHSAWEPESPWDVDLRQFLATDPSLALAKLRIDIERELRRIAFESRLLDDRARSLGVGQLARELVAQQYLPPDLDAILRDILPALNSAIHGSEIGRETAAAAARIGGDLLSLLRGVSGEHRRTTG